MYTQAERIRIIRVHSQAGEQTWEVGTVTLVGHEYLLTTIFVLGCLDFLARLDGTLF